MNEEERSEEEIPHNSQQNLKTITTMFWLKAKFLFIFQNSNKKNLVMLSFVGKAKAC